ncbi:MBL fold metallo-hydrolase [Flavilitoribacter nigricans]|uniref:MBL fold metallo-hydrolase n=1 Tax=Flavilitoribacter nigricans (strain ATCC 23147 / DSM 23189 / NBRC 102662 / NCIMB 1420 / SS-2) TaxID=1122177 RepID=A0A2D0NBT3_FLAN2|nr:MBL fold metallo-hydrolase [Flavilitoribacter nigricans]PHN05947.1 MBL fold metallo-hydrolase [Flavilitoribacter nigricans DSM 23189 = NBRC 102662]
MLIEQIYTGCLAQGAYYIESEGEAAIIDPLRETKPYLDRMQERGARIKYIFETHFHADFVSGHLDLAQKTGATIVYGPNAETAYEKYLAKDGEEFQLGKVTIRVLHTPGHTPESTTYLLLDKAGKPHAIFSGDTLFIGDVGRPDLAQKKGSLTKEDLAGWLYDSLRNKIMTLPDEVIVYPAHGAGSACGKNMSSETWSTLGEQKRTNYALRADMTKEEFIKEVTDGLQPPPQYFAKNAKLNKTGYESFDTVMERGAVALSPKEFEDAANATDAVILDVRDKNDFVKGFIPNSIFIGLDGTFAPWVGALIPDLQQAILIVAPEGQEEETVKRLSRVGYDNAIGYLEGSFAAWAADGREVDQVNSISVEEFAKRYNEQEDLKVLDVRKPGEWEGEHLENSDNFPLDFISSNMHRIQKDNSYTLHCRSGYRSTIAASILKSRGFENIVNVLGTFEEMASAGMPTTDYVCPSKKVSA